MTDDDQKTVKEVKDVDPAGIGKVIMLSGSYPPMPCGVGDFSFQLATTLASKGLDIEVVADIGARGVEKGSGPYPIHAVVDNWGLGATNKLVRIIENLKPDILHIQYPTKVNGAGLAVPLLPMRLKSRHTEFKILVTLHEFKLAHQLRKQASYILIESSDGVVMPCPLELSALIERHISVEEMVHDWIPGGAVGPNPADFDKKTRVELRGRVRSELGYNEDDILLLHYGTPIPSKGLEDLFKALKILKAEGLTPNLLIAGDYDPSKNDFHKKLSGQPAGLGVAGQVRWLGRIDVNELPGIFLASDAGVFPFLDGFSFRRTSLVGPLMWDVPLITTRPDGEFGDILIQEKVKFVEAGKPKILATAILNLIGNPRALEIARQADNPLSEYFKWDTIAGQYLGIYRILLDQQ